MIFKYNEYPINTYISIFILLMASLSSGAEVSNAPSKDKAIVAAQKIFGIIDEKSKVDIRKKEGELIIKRGEIEFCDIKFIYPSRLDKIVINNMNI